MIGSATLSVLDPAGVRRAQRRLDDRGADDRQRAAGCSAISRRSPSALREPVGVDPAERARAFAAALGELVADPRVAAATSARAPIAGPPAGPTARLRLLDEAVLVLRQARLGLEVARATRARRRARRRGPAAAPPARVPDGRSSTRPVRWPAAYAVETWTKYGSLPSARSARSSRAGPLAVELEVSSSACSNETDAAQWMTTSIPPRPPPLGRVRRRRGRPPIASTRCRRAPRTARSSAPRRAAGGRRVVVARAAGPRSGRLGQLAQALSRARPCRRSRRRP